MPPLQLPLPLRGVGTTMNQLDAEACADRLQSAGPIRRAVVDHQFAGDAALEDGLFEYAFDVERGLAEAKRAVGDQARGIVEEGDEVGFAPPTAQAHLGSMQDIAVPDIVCMGGREAASFLGDTRPGGRSGNTVLLQQPMDCRAGAPAALDLAGMLEPLLQFGERAARVLALGGEERLLDGRLELGAAAIGPELRRQAIESIAQVSVIPALQRLLGAVAAARAGDGVLLLRQIAQHRLQLAALERRATHQRA